MKESCAALVLAALLERAHPARTGHVILDLPGAACPPPSMRQPGFRSGASDAMLSETVETVRTRGADHPAIVFVACEASRMRSLRRLALDELRVARERVFTSGQWKAGLTTEEIAEAKRRAEWFGDASGLMPSNSNKTVRHEAPTAGRGHPPS